MNRPIALGLVALFAGTALAPRVSAQQDRVTVIRNGTVVPVVGAPIPNGTIIVRAGRIEAVGRDLTVPAGARTIDATGLFVYPGMIDSGTELGLTEIGSVPGGNDTREVGDFNPANLALTAVNPHSELIPVAMVNGVTSAITGAGGSQISGYAALIDLAGWTPAEMAVATHAALVVAYPRSGGGRFGGRRGGQQGADQVSAQVKKLMEYFQSARAYGEARSRTEAAGGRLAVTDLNFEAMLPALEGKVPVIFDANSPDQIRGAIALADSFGLRPIIRGGTEAWQVADLLAARKVPVIVGPTTDTPGDSDPYDMIYANPGVLAKAGVQIAFRTNSASDSRNLPYNAALAVAYGLDADEALRAITINPARIWGVADQLGSIEPGKVANLMVTTGDPLDVRTSVRQVMIRGELQSLEDRHTRLYQQFRARPRP